MEIKTKLNKDQLELKETIEFQIEKIVSDKKLRPYEARLVLEALSLEMWNNSLNAY